MPKRIRQQRRGKGTAVFRAPSFHFKFRTRYPVFDIAEGKSVTGHVTDLVNDPGRSAPVMLVQYEDGKYATLPAPYGIKVGDKVSAGAAASVQTGNVLPLKYVPAGTDIYNLEVTPGDGGKLVKAAGVSAKVVSHEPGRVIVKMPSKQFKIFDPKCIVTIGTAAGFGRKEKPIVKAGKHYYMQKARGRYWPMVAGVAMNAINHPFGGKRRSTQKSMKLSAPRNAPPGRKVGSIAPRRTGRKK